MNVSDFGKQDTLTRRRKKDKLLEKLNEAKNAQNYDSDYVDELEQTLRRLIDDSMGILTKHSRISLQNLSLGNISAISNALNSNIQGSLEMITDENGQEFQQEDYRAEYIYKFYENIYSKIPNCSTPLSTFMSSLGSTVQSPVIDENLFSTLTCDISVTELADCIQGQNGGSAPGLDQVPARLIKKISSVIIPLMVISFNFVLHGHGDFSPSAKTAKVRLIPKNSNCDSLRNWRPISLTNNMFKLYSKILAKRLAAILPKILGNSQKVYMKQQIISEASENIIEYIEKNKDNDSPTFLMALDFSKAFDTLSHSVIIQALQFFKFPPEYISIIKAWLSNRKSCIILGRNKLSKFFDILTGVPQGDPLSGFLFILVIELLLLKIESFTDLKPPGTLWNGSTPLLNEGFADDLLSLIKCSLNALSKYKEIVTNFGDVSNLKLNLEKTKLLIIGKEKNPASIIAKDCGFKIHSDLTHLGIKIDDDLSNLAENWDVKIKKMKSLKNMLLALKPNLTMKITLCKTFLFSQITYLAPVIQPTKQQLPELESIILKFLYPRKHTFTAERTFTDKKALGLNIPRVTHFINSLALNFAL